MHSISKQIMEWMLWEKYQMGKQQSHELFYISYLRLTTEKNEKYDQNLFLPATRFEPPLAPNVQIFQETAIDAFPMCIVGFAVAFAVAKVYAVKHDYVIDGNQVSFTVM